MIVRLLYRTGALSEATGGYYQPIIAPAPKKRKDLEQEQRQKQEELEATAAQIAQEEIAQAAEQAEAAQSRKEIVRLKEQSRLALERIKALQTENAQIQLEIARQGDEVARVLMMFMMEM